MIKAPYDNVYGVWKVTTEGDCEGRSTRDLGTHIGYIDEIAFALADKCYYSLSFKAIDPIDMTPKRKNVNIHLCIDSGTWNMEPKNRAIEIGNLMKNRPVTVSESNFAYCVTLTTNKKTAEEKRAEALTKLSLEERRLLGLV